MSTTNLEQIFGRAIGQRSARELHESEHELVSLRTVRRKRGIHGSRSVIPEPAALAAGAEGIQLEQLRSRARRRVTPREAAEFKGAVEAREASAWPINEHSEEREPPAGH